MKVYIRTCVIVVLWLHVCSVSSEAAGRNNEQMLNKELGNEAGNYTANTTKLMRVVPIMFGRATHFNGNVIQCSESIEEFPNFFTDEQRKNGAIALAVIIAVYCFTIIAIICDSYFLPCVERICVSLNLSQDVAAATFMSIATSAPELFVNIIGTFVTESDIGIGTVVGSSMFNTLGVASIGGLAATAPIQLDWWPVTRDTVIYIASITLLVIITWDGVIYWYEALILFFVYFLYFTIMFQNVRISRFFRSKVKKFASRKISEEPTVKRSTELTTISCIDVPDPKFVEAHEDYVLPVDSKESDDLSVFKFPKGHWVEKIFFVYSWPIRFILFCTIPDCKRHKKVYPLTFIMCVFWIGTNSYIVSWMITVIGYTLGIQDSVLGLTFLAAGGCLPEAISITITSRKGVGAMGVSNALGANTMNILLSLGFPWFIKTTLGGSSSITIVSGSLEYTIIGLILVAITLYTTLIINKFRLSRISGTILMVSYSIFLILAILSELVFFDTEQCSDIS